MQEAQRRLGTYLETGGQKLNLRASDDAEAARSPTHEPTYRTGSTATLMCPRRLAGTNSDVGDEEYGHEIDRSHGKLCRQNQEFLTVRIVNILPRWGSDRKRASG